MAYPFKVAQNPALVEDLEIYPRIVALAACMETELTAAGLPFTLVLSPEGEVNLDFCGGQDCQAQAWIRIITASPYNAFPNTPEGPVNCNLMIGYQLEVGYAHCAPSMDGRNFPKPEEQMEAMRVQTAAMSALLRAIRCCANGDTDIPWSLGEYVPGVNEGGCLTASWSVTVGDRREA